MWHSSLQQKTKQKTIPTNAAIRISLLKQRNSQYVLPLPCFLIGLYNPITNGKKKQVRIHISGSTSHKQVLRTRKCVVVGVLICNEIYFDSPDMNSACEQT